MPTQAFLPVISYLGGKIYGFYAISNTVFAGNETQFALTAGNVPIKKVTLPRSTIYRQPEFMAAYFPRAVELNGSFKHHAEYVDLNQVLPSRKWFNSSLGGQHIENPGYLLNALIKGSQIAVALTPVIPTTVQPLATLAFTTDAPIGDVDGITHFDFNWVDLFKVEHPLSNPASIEVVSQPAEGDLRAFVVASAQPVINQITNNTIRVVKTINGPMPLGARVFQFKVNDLNNLGQFNKPNAPTLGSNVATGGTLANATYFYSVSAIFPNGESVVSNELQVVAAGTNQSVVTINFTIPTGATHMRVYRRTSSAGTLGLLATVTAPTATYADNGGASPNTATQPKSTNVTLTVNIT